MDHPRIHRDPEVMTGKPVIRGTRITVEHVLRELAGGVSVELLAEQYGLAREDIAAALAYAADHLRHEGRAAA